MTPLDSSESKDAVRERGNEWLVQSVDCESTWNGTQPASSSNIVYDVKVVSTLFTQNLRIKSIFDFLSLGDWSTKVREMPNYQGFLSEN
jgi:hypothetical protein